MVLVERVRASTGTDVDDQSSFRILSTSDTTSPPLQHATNFSCASHPPPHS